MGCVKSLVSLLGSVHDHTRGEAASVLQNLSNAPVPVQHCVIEAGAIPYLTQLVVHANDSSKVPAITALYHLSFGVEATRAQLAGSIGNVVGFVSDRVEAVRSMAVGILQNVALDSPERQALIAKCNPIPAFHKLFTLAPPDMPLLNTLGALALLSDDVRTDVDKNGLVPLVATALHASVEGKQWALAAAATNVLASLANGPDSVRRSIVKCGALDTLIAQLSSHHHDLQYNSMAAVCGMCHGDADVRAHVSKHPDYTRIVGFLGSEEDRLRVYASDATWCLCDGGEAVKAALARAGAVGLAVERLEDPVYVVRGNVAGLLCGLADPPERRTLIGLTAAPTLLTRCVAINDKERQIGV